jgi:hypothetical protein
LLDGQEPTALVTLALKPVLETAAVAPLDHRIS